MGDSPQHAPAAVGRQADTAVRYGAARATLGLLLLLSTATTAFAQLTIQEPRNDSLTSESMISVGGTGASNAVVRVRVGNKPAVSAEVDGPLWSANVVLADGLNEVIVTSGQKTETVLVTRATMFVEPKRQKVFLRWSAAATEKVKEIAVGTRTATLTPQNQVVFANSVKQRTRAIIAQNFSQFGIDIVDAVAEGDEETHTIDFLPDAWSKTYGNSPHDCLNSKPKQTSNVYVGTFRNEMVNHFDDWKPMAKSDPIERRIFDVAHALARTASHELGHSLGLVTPDGPSTCAWMLGCDSNHTCQNPLSLPLARRFADGRYIMDAGNLAKEFTRIGEKNAQARVTPRVPATFNAMNTNYLLLIHPP